MKVSQRTLGRSQSIKGHNYVRNVYVVMELNLFTSSDSALYLFLGSNISKRFTVIKWIRFAY